MYTYIDIMNIDIMNILIYSHCSFTDANSTEFDPKTKNPVVSIYFSPSHLFFITLNA